jgi:predicted dehydrogenase
MSKRIGLIVGVGSIGRRHAVVMAERYEQLFVVDAQSTALDWCRENLGPSVRLYESIDALIPAIKQSASDVTAVISTWGPYHFAIFSALVDAGVRIIYCEKPVAVSLKQVSAYAEKVRSYSISFNTGLHLRYRNLGESIIALAKTYLGGPPSLGVIAGGAKCMATNGIHWLDLASCIFGSPPSFVLAGLQRHEINPRTSTVGFWQGVGTWGYSDGRFLSVSYSNYSSVDGTATWFCPFGTIRVTPSLEILVDMRNLDEVAKDSRVTRVGEVMPINLPIQPLIDRGSILARQLDDLENGNPIPFEWVSPLSTVEALLGAFESSHRQTALSLPVSNDVLQSSIEWEIS